MTRQTDQRRLRSLPEERGFALIEWLVVIFINPDRWLFLELENHQAQTAER